MNCEDFEVFLADALGGELSSTERSAFDAHLAECSHCRLEYESLARAIRAMWKVPGPPQVTLYPRENESPGEGRPPLGRCFRGRRFARQAAGIVLAFAAGYAMHAGVGRLTPQTKPPAVANSYPADKSVSLRTELVNARRENPGRSDLAQFMITVLQ